MTDKKPLAPKIYVIAENRDIAAHQLGVELKWKRAGNAWLNPEGQRVTYITGKQFVEIADGSRVYCAHRWYAHTPPHTVHAREKAGTVVLIHLNA